MFYLIYVCVNLALALLLIKIANREFNEEFSKFDTIGSKIFIVVMFANITIVGIVWSIVKAIINNARGTHGE